MNERNHPEIEDVEVLVSSVSRKRDMFLPVSILIAAVMVGGVIVFATLYKGGAVAPAGGVGSGNVVAATSTVANPAAAMALGSRDAILGNASATVTLIEYGD